MSVVLNPYLNFRNSTREAMGLYASVFGGEPTFSTFAENPGMGVDPAEGELIMHSQLVTDNGITLMAADAPAYIGEPSPNGTVSLSGDDADTLRGYWDGLSAGGTVVLPLAQAPWGDWFGQLTDRFGVSWMVNIAGSSVGG